MKTQKLTLDRLQDELEVLEKENLNSIKGGVGGGNGGIYTPDTGTPITSYLSTFFGVEVTSSTDSMGNWMISIGGSDPIPLTFQLDEVSVTASGGLVNSNGFDIYSSWGDWLGENSVEGNTFYVIEPGGGGTSTPPASTDVETIQLPLGMGYVEKITLSHLDAYNYFDALQSANTTTGIATTIIGFTIPATSTASGFLTSLSTIQGLQWASIESAYMNSGNLNGVEITRTVTNQPNFPSPYVTYVVKDSNGNEIGSASGPGY